MHTLGAISICSRRQGTRRYGLPKTAARRGRNLTRPRPKVRPPTFSTDVGAENLKLSQPLGACSAEAAATKGPSWSQLSSMSPERGARRGQCHLASGAPFSVGLECRLCMLQFAIYFSISCAKQPEAFCILPPRLLPGPDRRPGSRCRGCGT